MNRQVVIAGGGPAGASAALELADAGVGSVLLDDFPQVGGRVWQSGFASGPDGSDSAPATAVKAAMLLRAQTIDARHGHEIIAAFPDKLLWVRPPNGSIYSLRYDFLIVATGATEIPIPVEGAGRPGVYPVGGLQSLLKSSRIFPEGPLVVAGAGPLLRLVALELARAGTQIAAIVDACRLPAPKQILAMARAPALLARGVAMELELIMRGVPILRDARVTRIRAREGADEEAPVDHVEVVEARSARMRRIKASTVAISAGIRPNNELTALVGCAHKYEERAGEWRPERTACFETTVDGVFAVGDCAGIRGVEVAVLEGKVAARAILDRANRRTVAAIPSKILRQLTRLDRFRTGVVEWSTPPMELWEGIGDAAIICRCEGTTAGEVRAAAKAYGDVSAVKLMTRAGMGFCQGRTCGHAVQALTAASSGKPLAEVGFSSVRGPLRPTPLGSLCLSESCAFESATAVPDEGS